MNVPEHCDHGGEGWPAFYSLPCPNEGRVRCSLCGTLGYRRMRQTHRGVRQNRKINLYACRVPGCLLLVVERCYSPNARSFAIRNGCREHPVRPVSA